MNGIKIQMKWATVQTQILLQELEKGNGYHYYNDIYEVGFYSFHPLFYFIISISF